MLKRVPDGDEPLLGGHRDGGAGLWLPVEME